MNSVIQCFKTYLQNIILSLEDRDAEELILVLCGYYRLLTDRELEIIQEKSRWSEEQGKFYLVYIRYHWLVEYFLILFTLVCFNISCYLCLSYLFPACNFIKVFCCYIFICIDFLKKKQDLILFVTFNKKLHCNLRNRDITTTKTFKVITRTCCIIFHISCFLRFHHR